MMNQPCTIEDILHASTIVRSIPRRDLTRILYELNSWNWPEELGEAPEGWESMTIDEKADHPKFRAICSELENEVSEKAFLRYHHTNNLGRSEEEFEDWWQSEIYDALKLLREKQNQQLCSNRAYSGKGSSEKRHSKVMFTLAVFLGTIIGNLLVYGIRFLLQFL